MTGSWQDYRENHSRPRPWQHPSSVECLESCNLRPLCPPSHGKCTQHFSPYPSSSQTTPHFFVTFSSIPRHCRGTRNFCVLLNYPALFSWCFHAIAFSILLLIPYLLFILKVERGWQIVVALYPDSLCLLLVVFREFMFNVIIDMVGFESTILLVFNLSHLFFHAFPTLFLLPFGLIEIFKKMPLFF